MSGENTILLPRFAAIFFSEKVHCHSCPTLADKSGLRFVGVGRDDDGNICLACEYQCPSCGKSSKFFDMNNRFTRYRWWDEFVERHHATPQLEYESYFATQAYRDLPKIGPMVVAGNYPGPVWVRGGYRGDVGPVMFLCDGIDDIDIDGLMRLERGRRVSLLRPEDPLCLPWTKTPMFAKVKDGDTFALDGRNWIKMSVAEVEAIILGHTFELLVPESDVRVTTPEPPARSGHGSTHAKKSRKGTRRPPRDSRPLDS